MATTALLLAACQQGLPQSSLEPAGPRAERINDLSTIVFWMAGVVFVLVEGAIIFITIRYRRRRREERAPVQIHGNNRLEILWTVIPALLLAGLAFPTVAAIFDLSRRPPGGDVLEVTVIGHQWWWEFRYPDLNIVTANELVVPVDTPVHLSLESAETPGGIAEFTADGQPVTQNAIPVIHSFWVPRLAGKQDLVPGKVETLTIEADETGTFLGQCTEYCGTSHANMRKRVIVETEQGFQEWVSRMQAPPAEPEPGSLAAQGAEFFQNFGTGSCLACHGVEPGAGGTVGPNLAHLASRGTFGAGLFETNRENLQRWLDDPRAMKPGVVMPDYNLTEEQIEAIAEYLLTLE
ncbi:MAG TPA: cytochrome c oxidase subunit II [Actinomycetota bacterium]